MLATFFPLHLMKLFVHITKLSQHLHLKRCPFNEGFPSPAGEIISAQLFLPSSFPLTQATWYKMCASSSCCALRRWCEAQLCYPVAIPTASCGNPPLATSIIHACSPGSGCVILLLSYYATCLSWPKRFFSLWLLSSP